MVPKKNKKTLQGASATPATSPEAVRQAPNWPALTPLVPEEDLALQEVLLKQIFIIPNLFTASLCKTYVSFLSSLPLTTTSGKANKGDAARVNDRYQVDDAAFAERLWIQTGLAKLVSGHGEHGLTVQERGKLWGGEVVGLNPNMRIYRYSKGHFFDQHYDDSNNVTIHHPTSPPVPARTTWTLLLYLTSPATGCMGGETVFYPDPPRKKSRDAPPEPFVVQPQVGLALLHRHGPDCMLHEGREVTNGEKWVIRSDVCVKR